MNPVLLGALVFFGAFFVFDVVWSFFILYHLLRFAPHRESAVMQAFVFLGVTGLLLIGVVVALVQVDWSASFFVATRF